MQPWPSIIPRYMSKKGKKGIPAVATSKPNKKKEVVIPERKSPDQMTPSWRFRRFDKDSEEWGLLTLQMYLPKVLEYLRSYEGSTWQDIKQMNHDNGKKKNHTVKMEGLTKPAIRRLRRINMDDIPGVFSLRFENMFRIIGIRDEAILDILWIDPNHEVCKTSH